MHDQIDGAVGRKTILEVAACVLGRVPKNVAIEKRACPRDSSTVWLAEVDDRDADTQRGIVDERDEAPFFGQGDMIDIVERLRTADMRG
jgi:hypothetical protein